MNALPEGGFRLLVERIGSAAVIRLAGELDLASAAELKQALCALEEPYACLILDVSDLTFIDSTGLNLTVTEHRRSRVDGFDFVLAGARGHVMRVLRLAGLDVTLPLAPDVESSLPVALAQRGARAPLL